MSAGKARPLGRGLLVVNRADGQLDSSSARQHSGEVGRMNLRVGLILAVLLVLGMVVRVPETGFEEVRHTANTGELTSRGLVGQTFVAERDGLSGVSVKFATYSNRENTKDVMFRLRESTAAVTDLRTVVVNARELSDNQLYRFSFDSIEDSGGKPYFWLVTSSESEQGDAVTVDIHGEDPYIQGSLYLIRDADVEALDAETLSKAGKATADVSFGLSYDVPFFVASWHVVQDVVRTFINTWDERRGEYVTWVKVFVPGLIWVLLLFGVTWWERGRALLEDARMRRRLLFALFLLAVLWRVFYAVSLPATNDEGNYLYDARAIREGVLAGGDGYVKAILVILWVSFWQAIGGDTLLAGRFSSILINALTLVPIYLIGREMAGKRAGLMAAATWALFGVTTVFGIYVHTQPLAIFFGVSGLAILYLAMQEQAWRWKRLVVSPGGQLFLGGLVLGLGVASRKSVLALGLVPLLMVLLLKHSWKDRLRSLVLIGTGFLLVIGLLLGFARVTYGPEGIPEVLGINSAADGQSANEEEDADQIRAYSLRGMTPFFRESLPLILLAVIGLGVMGIGVVANLTTNPANTAGRPPTLPLFRGVHFFGASQERIRRLLAWVPALAAWWWAWSFFFEYEGSSIMVFRMRELWYAMGGVLAIVVAWTVIKQGDDKIFSEFAQNEKRQGLVAVLFPVAWLAGMVLLYMNWIKFHANYIGEFLAPLVLLAGVGSVTLFDLWRKPLVESQARFRKVSVGVTVFTLIWALFVSGYVTFVHEHTGTFHLGDTHQAAQWARENIPLDESIFTGAGLIPYLSGHHTALDIGHPRWYAYQWIREDIPRITAFLPPAEEMLEAYREAQWFLLEKQTGFSFLMEYSEIEAGLERDWEVVKEIDNGSNTLTFLRRK